MKPLIILLGVFTIGLLIKALRQSKSLSLSTLGRIAMSAMLFFTSVSHFIFTAGMATMLWDWVPYKDAVVYGTGLLEVIAAIALLLPQFKRYAGWGIIVFFLAVLPANINAAIHGVDPLTGTLDGPGSVYLFFRIPLQFFFIGWTYVFSIARANRYYFFTT